MSKRFLWAIILALSAIFAEVKAQRYYLLEDLSFTGVQYIWKSRALFELSDPDMWLYYEDGYAPALQYLPPFRKLRPCLPHTCRSYTRWGYRGMIGYRVLTDAGYYFLSPICAPIFLGLAILDDWVGMVPRMLYRTYADLSYLHFRVHAFDNIWRHHRFYDYYPRHGHRSLGWYDNHHCHVRPPRPLYRPATRPHDNGRGSYGSSSRSNQRAANSRAMPRRTESTGSMRQSRVSQRSGDSFSSSRRESYRRSAAETRPRSQGSVERNSVRQRSSSSAVASRPSGDSGRSGDRSRRGAERR